MPPRTNVFTSAVSDAAGRSPAGRYPTVYGTGTAVVRSKPTAAAMRRTTSRTSGGDTAPDVGPLVLHLCPGIWRVLPHHARDPDVATALAARVTILTGAFAVVAGKEGKQAPVTPFQLAHAVPPVSRARRRRSAARVCARNLLTSAASLAAPRSVRR